MKRKPSTSHDKAIVRGLRRSEIRRRILLAINAVLPIHIGIGRAMFVETGHGVSLSERLLWAEQPGTCYVRRIEIMGDHNRGVGQQRTQYSAVIVIIAAAIRQRGTVAGESMARVAFLFPGWNYPLRSTEMSFSMAMIFCHIASGAIPA